MTMTVLVPSDEGRAALADIDNASPVVYDPGQAMPDEAVHAEVLIVPPGRARQLLAAMRDMPRLRLVQTLSAGIDQWAGKLPDGVGTAGRGWRSLGRQRPLAWPLCVLRPGRRQPTWAVSCCSW